MNNVNALHIGIEESTQTCDADYEHKSTQTKKCHIEENFYSCLDIGSKLPVLNGHLQANLLRQDPQLTTRQRQRTLARNIVNSSVAALHPTNVPV